MNHEEEPTLPILLFTDGSCKGNPGPGGWAARVCFRTGAVVELGGSSADTTNNRMELRAVVEGLKAVGRHRRVFVLTDSEYILQGVRRLADWKQRGWYTKARTPVANQDLWACLDPLLTPSVHWAHVRGHTGCPENERCDRLARAFALGQHPILHRDLP